MRNHHGIRFGKGVTITLWMWLLIGLAVAGLCIGQAVATTVGDDFDDNSKDPTKWGADEVDGKGVMTEINQRLEYTTTGKGTASHDSVDRKFKTQFSYNADWAIQIDVTNSTSSGFFSSFGIDVRSVRLPDNEIEVELAQGGQFWAEFYSEKAISGLRWAASSGPNLYGAVRMAFDSTTKVFTVYYDNDPSDGYQWTEFGSFGVAGSGGANGNTKWGLTSTDQFVARVFGYSEKADRITSGQLYGDNFLETDGGILGTSHNELGGGESKATAVAPIGSKSCVAVSGKQGDGNWYGEARVYKPNGTLAWKSTPFNLNDGRTTAIAASGPTVYGDGYFYVAGYYGTAGSGSEQVFVRAYDAIGKTFKWEYKVDAPNAGLYPVGVAALGNNVVGFYNTDTGALRGKLIGLKQLTGALKWQRNFGDDTLLSSKVNAIAINGSKVAVAGYNQDNPDYKWVSYGVYFAASGKWDGGGGTHMSGPENEALAVAWNGSIIGVVGYLSPYADNPTRIAYAKYVKIFADGGSVGGDAEVVWDMGTDSRFTAVAVKDKKIYATGYGLNDTEQVAFVKAYDLVDPYSPAILWGDTFDLSSSGGMVPTGIILGLKGPYVAGYGLGASDVTDWFVKAFTPSGETRWLDVFNLNGGNDSKAFGIAASSSAIVAVGQAKNGLEGPIEAVVRSYKP